MVGIAVERAQLYARSAEAGAAEERIRIAREIHDTLAQGLSAIALRLDTADALLEADSARDRVEKLVREALQITRANLDEARRTVLDLRAAPLEGRTLAEALADMATQAGRAGGPDVRFEAAGAAQPLPARIEIGLFRVAQEALTNALSHAGAQTIAVHLGVSPHDVTLSVEDDGHGFDIAEVERGRFGLIGMRERARLLGGQLQVASASGEGTRLVVRVPTSEREPGAQREPHSLIGGE